MVPCLVENVFLNHLNLDEKVFFYKSKSLSLRTKKVKFSVGR